MPIKRIAKGILEPVGAVLTGVGGLVVKPVAKTAGMLITPFTKSRKKRRGTKLKWREMGLHYNPKSKDWGVD